MGANPDILLQHRLDLPEGLELRVGRPLQHLERNQAVAAVDKGQAHWRPHRHQLTRKRPFIHDVAVGMLHAPLCCRISGTCDHLGKDFIDARPGPRREACKIAFYLLGRPRDVAPP